MLRLLTAALLVIYPLFAQVAVTVANPLPTAQHRWVVCATPQGMPLQLWSVDGVLAVPGPTLGQASQLWFLRPPPLAGGQVFTGRTWQPIAVPDDWRPSWPSLDRPLQDLVPRLGITQGGRRLEAACTSASVEASPVRQVWRLELHAAGWHLIAWQTAWVDQLAIDVCGVVVWSDPATAALWLEDVTVDVTWGAPFHLHNASRSGATQATGTWTLWRGKVLDAVGFPFRGTLLGDGPGLLAAAEWPDGTFMGFGSRPKVPAVDRSWFDGFAAGTGKLTDWRPGASNPDPGSTGDQGCFGAQQGLGAAGGDVWALRELLWAADDGACRGAKYLERDGSAISRATHPRWETFGLATERNSRDRLGKAAEAWGWNTVNGWSKLIDDQHRGTGPEEVAEVLTGDPLLAWDLSMRLHADGARAKLARGQLDAPRASGRWWQSLAKMALQANAQDLQTLRALAIAELDLRVAQWAPGSPVRPTLVLGPDPRVLPDYPSWVPWGEGLCALGALEQARTWQRLGDAELGARFLAFARELGRTVARFGVLQSGGKDFACTGVQWFAGGAAPPDGYYTYPRDHAGTESVPGLTLLVGGGGWLDWMGGGLIAAADGGDAIAAAIVLRNRPPAGAPNALARWWACR